MSALLIKLLPYISDRLLDMAQAYIVDALARFIAKVKNAKRAKAQAEAKKEYDVVLAKPDTTVEERAKAYEKYLNSGR